VRSSFSALVDRQINSLAERPDSSARVLLVSVFGDSLHPRGGAVWLTSLAALVAPFGVSDRLVRTSVRRLVAEGILERNAVGRRSFYSVAAGATADFDQAESRIYHHRASRWDRRWTLVLVPPEGLDGSKRARLRDRLGWIGFDAVTPTVFASPTLGAVDARNVVAGLDLTGEVVVLCAETDDDAGGRLLTGMSGALDTAGRLFRIFTERYGDIASHIDAAGELTDQQAFCLRTLVVHDYRRAVLVDPGLPTTLVPEHWMGERAYAVARTTYSAVTAAADRHVQASCVAIDGALGPPDARAARRFGDDQAS
jgi:phenylacetic acid degradation operon negative regulatory protein